MTDKTLSSIVLALGSSEDFAPFTVTDGVVTVGKTVLVQPFNERLILVYEADALRVLKKLDDMIVFGTLVTQLRESNVEVEMSTGYADFMRPTARFDEFVATGASFGIDLTPEERAAPALMAAVRDKFVAAFTPPVPPRVFAPVPEYEPAVQAWLDNKSPRSVTTPALYDHNGFRYIRIGYRSDGTAGHLRTSGDYTIAIRHAERLWNTKLKKAWEHAPVDGQSLGNVYDLSGIDGRTVRVYGNHVEIGCQTVGRDSIERIARILNWEM